MTVGKSLKVSKACYFSQTSIIIGQTRNKITGCTWLINAVTKSIALYLGSKIAALPGQFQSALEDAILLFAPQAKTYSLPRKTISNQAEIDSYVAELKTGLENLLRESSSIILK